MLSDVPYIETYRGFASEHRLIYNCRLLKDHNHVSKPNDRWWENLRNTYRKAASREIPYANVQATFEDQTIEATSDNEGYVYIDIDISIKRDKEEIWKSIILSGNSSSFSGEILIPSCDAQYGIISDIDDTVLVTDVHSSLRMAINSLFKNPYQRKSFDGMDDFFYILQNNVNPVFYLSNSPWNLYQNIQQFLSLNNMPKGPILLRDYGMHFPKFPISYTNHKEKNIELLLAVYPQLPFILIGDASKDDAVIYSHIKNKYPDRIKDIYIREVNKKGRMENLLSDKDIEKESIQFFRHYSDLL